MRAGAQGTDPAEVLWLHGSRHDADRSGPVPSPGEFARARYEGRFPIDEFGFDPQLQDLIDPIVRLAAPVRVVDGERIPTSGSAVLVCNRAFGVFELPAIATAVRRVTGRHLRAVGVPHTPGIGTVTRKLGVIDHTRADVSACLHLGHIVGVPLSRTFLRTSAGHADTELMMGALGHRVYPVAIRQSTFFGVPALPWVVQVGEMIRLDAGEHPLGDPLAAAELADRVRSAVDDLLATPV